MPVCCMFADLIRELICMFFIVVSVKREEEQGREGREVEGGGRRREGREGRERMTQVGATISNFIAHVYWLVLVSTG